MHTQIKQFLLNPLCAKSQEIITLNTDFEPALAQKIRQEEQNPLPLITAPKDSKEVQTPQEPLRSGLAGYDPMQEAASDKFFLYNVISKTAKDVYNLQIERTDIPSALLKDQLTFNIEKGPVENIHIWTALQSNFSTTVPERGDTDSKFDMGLINILIDGKFKGGKENFRIMLDPTHRHSHMPFMQPFFQDLYIETHRIPHTSVLVGNSRKLYLIFSGT